MRWWPLAGLLIIIAIVVVWRQNGDPAAPFSTAPASAGAGDTAPRADSTGRDDITASVASPAASSDGSVDAGNDAGSINAQLQSALGSAGDDVIGRSIELRMPAPPGHDIGFVVGSGEQAIVVVLDRDTRDLQQRQQGIPADHALMLPPAGTPMVLSGTVQRAPSTQSAEFDWQLTESERAVLGRREIYIRAERVRAASPQDEPATTR